MREDLTAIMFLQDGSASMTSLRQAVVDGINNLIEEQKKLPGDVVFSLAQFNTKPEFTGAGFGWQNNFTRDAFNYKLVYDFRSLHEIRTMELNDFVPSGNTPLRDAMGKAIDDFGRKLASIPEQYRPSKVVFVTFTDGKENASLSVTPEQLREKVAHQEAKYSWKFAYLGANQDSFAVGVDMGISKTSIMNYQATYDGTLKAMSSTSGSLASYRTGQSNDMILPNENEAKTPASK